MSRRFFEEPLYGAGSKGSQKDKLHFVREAGVPELMPILLHASDLFNWPLEGEELR